MNGVELHNSAEELFVGDNFEHIKFNKRRQRSHKLFSQVVFSVQHVEYSVEKKIVELEI